MDVFSVRVQMLWYNFQYRNSISSFDYPEASVKPETSVEGNVEGDVDGDSMDYAPIPRLRSSDRDSPSSLGSASARC
jgi:hypothetical protein